MVGNTPDAEDIVQEVLLRVMGGWSQFRHTSGERTWIWAITRNCLREHYRTRHRDRMRKTALQRESTLIETSRAPRVSTHDLMDALQDLPLAQRQVFICRAIQDLSSRETATLLGWSEAKVRVTLHRSVTRLREVFSHD